MKQGLALPASGDLTGIARRLLGEARFLEHGRSAQPPAPMPSPPAAVESFDAVVWSPATVAPPAAADVSAEVTWLPRRAACSSGCGGLRAATLRAVSSAMTVHQRHDDADRRRSEQQAFSRMPHVRGAEPPSAVGALPTDVEGADKVHSSTDSRSTPTASWSPRAAATGRMKSDSPLRRPLGVFGPDGHVVRVQVASSIWDRAGIGISHGTGCTPARTPPQPMRRLLASAGGIRRDSPGCPQMASGHEPRR